MISNKKMIFSAFFMSSALVLAACGNDDEVTQQVTDEAPTETEVPENESTEDASPSGGVSNDAIGGETFGFMELSVDVDMPDEDDAIDISYEEDRDSVEAEYENKIDGINVSGDDAMNEIESSLSQLDITSDTPDDEVISQVVEAFGIDAGYQKIEIDVTYADDTDKEYEHTNQ